MKDNNLEMLDTIPIKLLIMVTLPYFTFAQGIITTHVARAVPLLDTALTGTPTLTVLEVSRLRCIVECTKNNCSSFNFGNRTCELFHTYLCEDFGILTSRIGFKHYDIESGVWIQVCVTSACKFIMKFKGNECPFIGETLPKVFWLLSGKGSKFFSFTVGPYLEKELLFRHYENMPI